MLQLMCTLQVLGFRAVEDIKAKLKDDRGQTAAEYLGIVVVVAGIIAALVAAKFGDQIKGLVTGKINEIGKG